MLLICWSSDGVQYTHGLGEIKFSQLDRVGNRSFNLQTLEIHLAQDHPDLCELRLFWTQLL